MVLCGTCDMPAKANVLNFNQFNGFFGCCKCLQQGETFTTEKGGNIRCFPFDEENPNGPAQTHDGTIENINSIMKEGKRKPIQGVKGPSALLLLRNYNLIKGTSIDYMHCVLLGITKLILS